MKSCASVQKELYIPSPGGTTVWARRRYLDAKGRIEEERSDEYMDDFHMNWRRRLSEDHGHTWSQWLRMPDPKMKDGYTMERFNFATLQDRVSGLTLQAVFVRLMKGRGDEAIAAFWQRQKTLFDHMFWEASADGGRNWSPMQALRYQEGPPFNPENWAEPGFLDSNNMYGGYNLVQTREGTIVYPGTIPTKHPNPDGTVEDVSGVICFIGRWNAAQHTYDWTTSSILSVPHRVSGMGLVEPAIAELENGSLLLSMRGQNDCAGPDPWRGQVESPGRTWISVSKEGGQTWGPVTDLRYDTGEPFYSPAALSKFVRSSRTGKLYWFGNITSQPPKGCHPRYPLVMAEVEESIPALKKDSLVVVADRDPSKHAEEVQFSNFCLLENRASGEIELYMAHFGQHGLVKETGAFDYGSDTWKYTLTPT
jgi:hypothetical protein